jgi:hypothetical protein
VEELKRQLNDWRCTLPPPLQWLDSDRTTYLLYDRERNLPYSETFVGEGCSLLERPPLQMYNADIVTAQLRGRFYYCQLMLFRPFLFKVLHMHDEVTKKDEEYAICCLQSCLQWPMCMGPPRNKKRLLPNTYVWTQSFVMILLLLKVAGENTSMRKFVDENKAEVDQTIKSMLAWLKDMRQMDAMAEWGLDILGDIYDSN